MADDEKKSDAFSDLGFDPNAFQTLEDDFQEVLTELVGDKSLEKFRTEYEKLHRALKKSHESEKRLIKRCRELNTEIVTNATKVQTALKLSQEDQKTITALRKEIEKAWKMVDASHDKEAQANTTINKIKAEIANLQRLVEQGAGLSVGQEHSVKELLKIKEDLSKERNTQAEQIQNLRGEITQLLEKLQRLETDKLELDTEIHNLKESLTSKHDEIDKEQRRKDLLDKDLRDLKQILDARQMEIKAKQQLIVQGQERIARLELQIKEQRLLTDKALKDYEQLNQRTNKLQQDLEEQVSVNVQLQADKAQRALELKAKQDEIQGLEQRELNANRLRSQLMKQKKELEDQLHDIEASKEALKNEIASLERDVESYKRQSEVDKKAYEDLVRERELINKNLVKVAEKQQKQVDLIKISESSKKNLEQEIQGYKAQAQKHRKMIYDLEKQREAFIQEASEATQKYLQALEEVKLREMTIADLQKKIAEAEGKLKQQQNLYEAVRSDRNMYSKTLIEAQDEIAEMKRKFKIMGHQIEQLKEEIATKDRALMKEHFEHMKVEKEKDTYKNEQERLKAQIEYLDTTIGGQQAEIQKLNQVINEADAERINQLKEYQRVKNERDILGSQLIRRNDELALLYEKVKLQQSTLTKGESQYHERMEDIRVLKVCARFCVHTTVWGVNASVQLAALADVIVV
eukprot:TRINITY_DN805_c0_g2_i2.p1 TRINITY_DN805_c0_g2~~TRINITY_DN805_c0_g2_i2.p1  ORF type:complete len:691 (+),score=375.87 TRINITY_DN805_c0_g2_i2:155-2227(+)